MDKEDGPQSQKQLDVDSHRGLHKFGMKKENAGLNIRYLFFITEF
jgi:hypothetical protein